MSKPLITVFSELEVKLAEIRDENLEFITETSKSIQLVEEYLFLIQEMLYNHQFSSIRSEIEYFKNEYPKIFRLYYYFKKLLEIEENKLMNCIPGVNEIEFYTAQLQELKFLGKNDFHPLCEYKPTLITKDEYFFLRDYYRWRRCNLSSAINDTYITNAISTALGKRDSIIDVLTYINQKLNVNNQAINNLEIKCNIQFNWTDHKCDLVELAYSIYSKKSLNNGNIELTNLINLFEQIFNVTLSNYSTTIQELKQRKKQPTKFIDELKDSLSYKLLE